MKNKIYLIVGVDPGITTGLCAIDLHGNIIKHYSSKRMGFEKIVSWINSTGTPIIIACDVEIPPQIIKKLSMQFKAKIFHPPKDLKVGEKQRITQGIDTEDDHQRDSCSAAILAYKKYSTLFKKVDYFLSKIGKEEKSDEIKKKILFGEARNIKEALKEKVDDINLQKKKRVKHKEKEKEATILKREINNLKEELEKVQKQLEKERQKNERLIEELANKKSDTELKKLANIRQATIQSLEEKILELKLEVERLKKENKRKSKEEIIIKKYDCYLIREIEDLSEKEIEKIGDAFGDAILVKKLSLPSKRTIAFLKKKKIPVILYEKGKKISDKVSVPTLPINEVKIIEENDIRFIKKEEVERALKSRDIIEKILSEYREKRIKFNK
jgi:predicted RNase H-like nuclease (RuvC/YqgF family)